MARPQDLDEEVDGVDETSTGESQATNQPDPKRATRWQDDPEYKKQQSKRDKAEAEANRRAWEAEQRLARMEQQMQQQYMSGLPQDEQLGAQVQILQRQLAEQQRLRDLDAFAIQRARDLEEIVRETGIPLEDIEEMPNVHAAWKAGQAYFKANGGKGRKPTRQEEIDEDADDTVDFATPPKAKGKVAKLQAEYDKHRTLFNVREQMEVMAKADAEGVTIREW